MNSQPTNTRAILLTEAQIAVIRDALNVVAEMGDICGMAPALQREDTPENEAEAAATMASLNALFPMA